MKPNDKAYAAAIKIYNIHSDYDAESVSLRLAVDAAFVAQFPPSEDYAGLVKWLRDKAESLSEIYPPEAEAADALEAVLAERDALKAELAAANTRMSKLDFERTAAELERDALLARFAPVDDEALVKIASKALHEKHGGPDDETYHAIVRCTLAAIRPHIEAAERERCVKAVKKVAGRINVPLYERPAYEDGYLQGVHDAAAAIRSGK